MSMQQQPLNPQQPKQSFADKCDEYTDKIINWIKTQVYKLKLICCLYKEHGKPPIGPPSLEILRDLEIDATIFLPLGTKLLKQETMAGIDRSNPGVALDQVFQAWIKEGDDTLTWEKLAIALDDIEGQKDMATEVRGLYQCCYDC